MAEQTPRDDADSPDPAHAPGKDKLTTLAPLAVEFLASFANAPDGKKHAIAYTRAREEAAANVHEIVEAAGRGEDVADRVLLQFLPHANTQGNRERGAWIHIAPAITKDVRALFEGAGWAKSEEWPGIARRLLEFVTRVVADPTQLDDACGTLAVKGVQSGMISPILNALRPDSFLVVNTKSCALFNYVAGTSHSTNLAGYPAANRTGFDVVETLAPLFASGAPEGIADADLADMFAHWLQAIRKFDYGKTSMEGVRYWKIAPGDGAWQWPECRNRGFIAVGWNEIGDVSGMTKEEFDAAVDAAAERSPADVTKGGIRQLWQFANIKPGDRIVANKGLKTVIGIGTVTGPYAFLASETRHAHRLPVRWDDTTEREYDAGRAWQWTIRELNPEQFDAILNAPPAKQPATPVFRSEPEPAAVPWPEYTLEQLSTETGLDPETLARWTRAIHRKGQAILYGPPGTGKTFTAERLARHLASGGFGLVETVQFHPAYAYEDFIVGIRPRSDGNGGLAYPLVDGVFVNFCNRAREREGLSVLIVDEINRANLARVFGELMFLLEYRDRTINLAGGQAFSIPENVRLLGTMNTADRSIALIDHALRRRFAFLALAPDYQVLARYHKPTGFETSGLVGVLAKLNRAIDDPHYEVGISFFLIEDLANSLEDVWRMEIEPYVEEYFFDRRARFEEFRWENVRREILGPEQP